MVLARLPQIAVAIFLAACAGVNREPPATTSMDRDIISFEEIDASNQPSAYDVIKKLRANFLNFRGRTSLANTSPAEPFVFVDEQAYGPLSSLRTIPANHVETIRMYRTWEAQTKFGTGLMGGVIAVYTRSQ